MNSFLSVDYWFGDFFFKIMSIQYENQPFGCFIWWCLILVATDIASGETYHQLRRQCG